MIRFNIIMCAALALGFQTHAGNWPAWRGPDANGISSERAAATAWSAERNILWKAPLPEPGNSTPIVWGERVFILTATDTGKEAPAAELPKIDPKFETKTQPPKTYHQYLVLCLDRNSGKVLWQREVGTDCQYPPTLIGEGQAADVLLLDSRSSELPSSSSVAGPRSPFFRLRTEIVPDSISLSPATSM